MPILSFKITGNVTGLEFDESSDHLITKLDLSECSTIDYLVCKCQELSELSLNKSNKLNYLDVSYNKLNTESLNALFISLPQNPNPWPDNEEEQDCYEFLTININSNRGTDDCDRSIAENKGWLFE